MGPRRVSLRPQPPSLPQRVLVVAVVVFSLGSLFCLHALTTTDWSVLGPSAMNARLRSIAQSPVLDHVVAKQQEEPTHPTQRAFLKQRASVLNSDQSKVVDMTKHAWNAYVAYGNWSDMLDVVNQRGATKYDHDMAFTAVDALDTLLIMGLHDEFDVASNWIKTHLRDRVFATGNVSFAEATTRTLGGLLAAYHLSGDIHLLQIANELGEALETGFTCGIFVPCRDINLEWGVASKNPSLADASAFLLEFQFLTQLVKKRGFLELIENFHSLSIELTTDSFENGLIPVAIRWETMTGLPSNVSFGSQGDTYYEYQLKQWIQTGKRNAQLKKSYLLSIDGLKGKMLGHTSPLDLTYIGLLSKNNTLERRMDHASCFMPGLLALGYHHGLPDDHLKLAKELMETCIQMYIRSPVNLAPTAVHFGDPTSTSLSNEFTVVPADDTNELGPETIESLLMLYRVTKDERYRQHGRTIMEAIENHSKVSAGGYRSLRHVFNGVSEPFGSTMAISFLSETLKYLYLLFSDDDLLALDDVVFNTHGHAFPILP